MQDSVDTFSSEIHTEHVGQLLHEDLSHLQRTNYNLQVLTGQHGGNVTTSRHKNRVQKNKSVYLQQ